MQKELRIVLDVVGFRVRRFEMANLGAALAVMLALRLPTAELVVRWVFGLLLNALVYLNNDYLDRARDEGAQGRDAEKTRFLTRYPQAAVRAQLWLLGLLFGFAVCWGGGLLRAVVLGGGICLVYSLRLKQIPGADVASMVAWGAAMPLVGVPTGSHLGYGLVAQLGLFSGVFETLQVLRDHDDDARSGIRTTAVELGRPRCLALSRILLAVSGIYAAFAFSPWLVALPLVSAVLPVRFEAIEGHWQRVRILLGITFAMECGLVWAWTA